MINAKDCAKLILINMAFYNKDSGKDIDKFLISKNTIKFLSDRSALRKSFIKQLENCLLDLGYVFIDFDDEKDRYAILNVEYLYSLKKITGKYVRENLEDLDDSEEINEVYKDTFNIQDDEDDDEDDN